MRQSKAPSRKRNHRFLFLFVGLSLCACSPAARQLFFDVPPPKEPVQEMASQASNPAPVAAEPSAGGAPPAEVGQSQAEQLPPPPIEAILSWEQAQAELPGHAMGGVDWNEALEQDIIRPRHGTDSNAAQAPSFDLDFYIKGPSKAMDAWFPHSAHTQWLSCENCHGSIYRYRQQELKMADLYAGKSCGACHGKVAFPVTQCKRCHIDM